MPPDASDLSELLARIANRDRSAFSMIYGRTSRRVFAIALKILENRAEAEDATQEIYLKIWRQAWTFDEDHGTASAWLNAVARNHAIDIRRMRKPIPSVLEEEFDLPSPAESPEDLAIASNEREVIDECMRRLPAERAQAVRRVYVEGHSYQELAEFYQVPLNTMRTWLRRSLITLRDCLTEQV